MTNNDQLLRQELEELGTAGGAGSSLRCNGAVEALVPRLTSAPTTPRSPQGFNSLGNQN